MEQKIGKYDRLISKYLEGSLTDQECSLLLDWLDQDQDHVAQFRKTTDGWEPASTGSLDESWNALMVKRHLRESSGGLRVTNKRSWGSRTLKITRLQLTRYAAAVIIGLLFSIFAAYRLAEQRKAKNVQWVVTETLAGQKTKVVLPDSSVVWLNSESVISFPSNFQSLRNRVIRLEGEAYFDITQQNRSTLTVKCPDYDIEVKGTQFNVMAYKDFNRTETTLVEGAVTIRRGSKTVKLNPGERAIYSRNYLVKSKAQIRQAMLWKERKFYFDNISFKELARRLERWYDVKITIMDPSLNSIYYSGYFKNEETVWQVLDVIGMTTPIEYERKQFREITIDRRTE
ncbi:MAG: FecR domain-containing protein [Bacteroidota bacterium]